MIWQDVLLMLGGFGFSLALIPAVKAREKPPVATSLTTGGILATFCIAYATLGLWLAFGATAITSAMWLTLLVQKIQNEQRTTW